MAKNYRAQIGLVGPEKENIQMAKCLDVIHERKFQVIHPSFFQVIRVLINVSVQA